MNRLQNNVFLTYFKATILLIATFCLGCIVAFGVARLLEKSTVPISSHKPDPINFRDVFVLKNTIREGSEILPEDLIIVQKNNGKVPRGAVKAYQQIEGRQVKLELPKGTLLLDEYFVTKAVATNAMGFIPPGFHSVPILIHEPATDRKNNISTVLPGDQVDVIIVQKDAESGDELGEFVLLEKIPVLDALWEEIGDSQRQAKKGTISLLLSDLQRKNLHEEFQEGTKIRLRVCPPVKSQTVTQSQPQNQLDLVDPRTFYQTGHQPDLISESLENLALPNEIEIVFRNSKDRVGSSSGLAGQTLKPFNQTELQFPVFRGISADANSPVLQVSSIDKSKSTNSPVETRSAPRYSSFYDTSGHYGKANMQWQVVAPRSSPLVYEANPNSETQARGVYRDGGVYFSAE